jgi:hypothetical protein
MGGILHGLEKVIAGGRRAVMALHVEGHPPHEQLGPQQGLEGTNHFGALFIDGGGVEIINRLILIRLNRMGRGACIFAELAIAQQRHILDPLHRCRMEIGGETGIPKNGEALLERELEPVAAGDAIAGPIVEILMGNHTFDPLQLAIGGGSGIGQHQFGVEDIEALVFHGAHVEVAHGNDVELIEVVFEAIDLLIPGHGALERRHGMGGVGGIPRLHMDAQGHLAATGRGEVVAHFLQLASHQGKQVGGLGERVVPDGVMALGIHQGPGLDAIAVGQQHRAAGPISLNPHPETAEQVGAIGVVGDAAEALGFALAGHHAAADIEPLQAAVGLRVNAHQRLQPEGPLGRIQQHQPPRLEPVIGAGARNTIQRQLEKLQVFSAELHGAWRGQRVGPAMQAGRHESVILENLHREIGAIQHNRSRAVIS